MGLVLVDVEVEVEVDVEVNVLCLRQPKSIASSTMTVSSININLRPPYALYFMYILAALIFVKVFNIAETSMVFHVGNTLGSTVPASTHDDPS